jgi:uncharacterized transporter YbjL
MRPPATLQSIRSMSRWLAIAIAAGSMTVSSVLAAADDAFIAASAGILMSRNMSIRTASTRPIRLPA